MIESWDISKYISVNSGFFEVNTYSAHHLTQLEKCLENDLFSSAYFHVHSMYILFIYIQLFRISQIKSLEFTHSLIGFPREEKNLLENSKGPFLFSPINEKTVFRFFRLVDFDDGTIANISACINTRNDHMHINGILNCDTEEKLTLILNEYEKNMEKIFEMQSELISDVYNKVLKNFGSNDFNPNDQNITEDVNLNFFVAGNFSNRELDFIKTLRTEHPFTQFLIANY